MNIPIEETAVGILEKRQRHSPHRIGVNLDALMVKRVSIEQLLAWSPEFARHYVERANAGALSLRPEHVCEDDVFAL
jgi:hypothetical protein